MPGAFLTEDLRAGGSFMSDNMRRFKMRRICVPLLILVGGLWSSFMLAQTSTGTLQGLVTDSYVRPKMRIMERRLLVITPMAARLVRDPFDPRLVL
jgi:cation transporter-like permease